MKNLNWKNLWTQMKSGSGSTILIGMTWELLKCAYRALNHLPDPRPSLAWAIVWSVILVAYLVSSAIVALLDRKSA